MHDANSQLMHIFIILFVLRWHAAWQERCQALEKLRACITRKRISFRLFKSWYWQTFDDDMQVRSDCFEVNQDFIIIHAKCRSAWVL